MLGRVEVWTVVVVENLSVDIFLAPALSRAVVPVDQLLIPLDVGVRALVFVDQSERVTKLVEGQFPAH